MKNLKDYNGKEVLKLLLDTVYIDSKDCGNHFIIKNYQDA